MCDICAENYYSSDNDTESVSSNSTTATTAAVTSNKCTFICDSGLQCKHSKSNKTEICNYHEKLRVPITCSSCNKSCCKICYRTFFLIQFNEPSCIHCKKTFDLEFLLGTEGTKERFTGSFIWGPYRVHRENVLLDQIKTRMPEYEIIYSFKKQVDDLKTKKTEIELNIKDLTHEHKQMGTLSKSYSNIVSYDKDLQTNDNVQEIKKFIKTQSIAIAKKYMDVDKQISLYTKEKSNTHTEYNHALDNYQNATDSKNSSDFINKFLKRGKCPVDQCTGVIEDKWECNTCHIQICNHCTMVKNKTKKDPVTGEEVKHVCKQEDIDSINEIRENTKSCPSCATRIQRSQGCNQMWCTICKVFFDWNTGKLIKNTQHVHNPHYTEWVRTHGEYQQNNPCGVLTMNDVWKYDNKDIAELFRYNQEILQELNEYTNEYENKVQNMAFKYISKEITLDELKKNIHRYLKESKKAEMTNERRRTYADTVNQILAYELANIKGLVNNNLKPHDRYILVKNINEKVIQSIAALREHTEESLKQIGVIFNSIAPNLNNIDVRTKRYDAKRKMEREKQAAAQSFPQLTGY